MYHKVMTVTPSEARDWLDTKNSRNRPVSQFAIDRYTQEIKAGNWKLNGQPIIFGKSGNILDGQHRLKAIVQANKAVELTVLYGVDDDTFDTLDVGNRRTLADVFAIEGETNTTMLAAGVRFVWRYATGQILSGTMARSKIATNQLFEKTLEKHPGLRRSVKLYSMLKGRTGGIMVPPGTGVGLHYLFSIIDEKKADEFFTVLQSGLGLSAGHPVALLRARLIAGKQSSNRLLDTAIYFYTVTAWNAFAKDQTMSKLSFNPEDKAPEIEDLPKSMMKELL